METVRAVYIKNVDGVKVPLRAHETDAGYDVVATSDPIIVGGKFIGVCKNGWDSINYIEYTTNLYLEPLLQPKYLDVHIDLRPRSSISKYNLSMANSPATIDSGYRGEILVRFNYIWQPTDLNLVNDYSGYSQIVGQIDKSKIYKKGDKICQLLLTQTYTINFVPVGNLSEADRGEKKFGDTGE